MSYLKSLLFKGLSYNLLFICAALTFSGCQVSSSSKERPGNKTKVKNDSPVLPSTPEAELTVDEAILVKPHALLGGVVKNIGGEKLEKLSVEFELRRRVDGSLERREVAVEPGDLAPGQEGKYSLKVLSNEWSGSRVVRLRSGMRPQDVAFKSFPGAKRPPERLPEAKVTVVKTPRQKSKSSGDEFINTPDNPIKVP